MNPELTQSSLLSRVRDPGDDAAWAEFNEKYRELIRRYCLARGLTAADAEDVHQMSMLRLFRVLPRFAYDRGKGRFRDYLYRTVRSAIADLRSRPNPGAPAVDITGLADTAAREGADELWEQEWADHHFRTALQTVRGSFEARSVGMFERLLAGETIESVAGAFETTPQAVHKVKQRIRDRLKELIEAQVRQEDEG